MRRATAVASAVRPLWAIEGGRDHDRRRPAFRSTVPRCREVRVGAQPARLVVARRRSSLERRSSRAGLEGGATPVRIDGSPARRPTSRSARRSRPGCTRSTTRSSIARAISTSPTAARAGRKCRCRSSASGRDGTREPFSSRHRQPDVDGDRSRRAAVRLEPVRGQRLSRRAATARTSRSHRSRRGVRPGVRADGTLFVGDRSGTIFRVDETGERRGVRDAAGERGRVSSGVRSGRRALRDGADARRRTTRSTASTPDGDRRRA